MTSPRECNICFDKKSLKDFQSLPCAHAFCIVCIRKLHRNVCPLCRTPFNDEYDEYSRSAPLMSTIHSNMQNMRNARSIDDMYIIDEAVVTRRINNRRRRRRRRRRLGTNRQRRRSENIEEIFQIDDIIEENTEENIEENTEENTESKNTSRKSKNNHKKDNWNNLKMQRSRYK